METAKDILEKYFGKEGYSFDRWAKDIPGGNNEKARAILAAFREIADKAWEAGQQQYYDADMMSKSTFMKSLFPLKEI